MNILKKRPYRQFFALLTILSITFTQACPAFALRPESGGSPLNKSGLEEALGGGTAVLDQVSVRSANMAQMTNYFSQRSEWQQVRGRSESERSSVLVGMFMDAIQDRAGTPPAVVLAMSDPAQYLPLALRLLVPGDTALHQRVDSQWDDLQHQCALCAAHILHENLDDAGHRDGPDHVVKDVLASVITAIDTAKLGRIPTRPVRPAKGHGEHEVVTQTAYSVSVVGGLTVFQATSPEEMMRAVAGVVPSTPSNEEPVSLPVIHVRALGSPNSAPANHYVAVEAMDFSGDRVHVLDNGKPQVMPVAQFIRQYRPTGLLFLSPEQMDQIQAAGFQFQSPTEQQLLSWTGDCGTCAIKGNFPAGYHAPIDWALISAGRLLYRGADGGTVQVRYRVGEGGPIIRSYRVAYNSTTQQLTFRVAEIGQDQHETVLHEENFSILEATERFNRKPSEIKRYMAKLLADLAHQAEFRIPVTATILDVVTHFRWATHGPSDIRGTHPHQARPEEVRNSAEPVAKTVTVAHNGIIYDYIELGIQLTTAGHTFESGVDSERFAHLVWEIIQAERPESLLEAVRRAMGRISLNDTYGFQIISNDYPEELVSARNESPIYLGIGETGLDSGAVPFFITAADPKAILPHTGIYSATLLPNRTVVQVKNDAMTVLNPDGLPYVLVMPNGSLTFGRRNDGQMVPAQVFIQQVDKSGTPLEAAPRSVSSLTREQMKQYNEGKLHLRVSTFDGGQPGPAQAGLIIFQKGVDNPSVYDLGDYPDYTTKELYQSGRGMRDTIEKNTVQVPVYYIPREISVETGSVRAYRAANLRTRSNAQDIQLTAEQAASIAGSREWTELVDLPDGRQVFLKRVPAKDVQTPMYDQLDLPEFPGIPSWDGLRDVDEVWGVSVGSSYNSDLDGFEFIRRYSGRGVRMLNSDDLRDDQHWMNDASGKKRIAVIATTQSGTTAVTKANMEKITNASGKPEAFGVEFLTIADTNTPGSDITKPEYTHMQMNEGLPPEIGVLSTAAVHSQKVNKELFGMRLGIERRFLRPEEAHDRIEQLKTISHQVDGVLASSEAEVDLREVAEEMVRTNQAIAGYRGLARGAASEMTIKLQEGGEINMITFNMGTFLHGPAQLLQFSKVPVGTQAAVEARYDASSGTIIASTHYQNPEGGSELRGFPIIVHYIPEEGDDGARSRLESNFQTVASRGASVYVFTSPEYAADLRGKTTEVPQSNGEKKSTSLVRRAFGYPANPYTLTALGQKLALMVAELKNTSMADKLFERARSINEAQVENVPPDFDSREEWIRQRLVDSYAEVVRFRENGWLAQVLFEEGVGSVLAKIDAAARAPGDRSLVNDARDSVARVVSYIDVAQPGKLAKSVTVEARFDTATRELLSLAGISQALLGSQLQGLVRIEEGQIQAYPGVIRLVSRLTGKSEKELTQTALHHEGAEFLLRFAKSGPSIREYLEREVPGDDLKTFQRKFKDEFGEVVWEDWPYEVAAQYYTALFDGNQQRIDRLFGRTVSGAIETAVRQAETDGLAQGKLHDLLVLRSEGRGRDRVTTIQRVSAAVRNLSHGARDLSIAWSGRLEEVDRALEKLVSAEQSTEAPAGLEEGIQPFEKTQQQVVQFVRGSISVLRSVGDSQADFELMDQIRPWLEDWGVRPEVRYGDPLGRSVRKEASGPDSRPFFQLTSLDGRPLFLALAYENLPQQLLTPRRVLLVTLGSTIRSSRQYWVFPLDEHLQGRLEILINQFVAVGPDAALPQRLRQVEGFLSQRMRQPADLPRLLRAYEGLEQEPSGAFFVEDRETDDLVFLVGAFPYRRTSGAPELNIALIDGIREVESRLQTKFDTSRLFVAQLHGEPPIAFFQVAFRRSALQGVTVDLVSEARTVVRPYLAVPSPAAGAAPVSSPVIPAAEFRQAFSSELNSLRLPVSDAATLVDEAARLFDAFNTSNGRPQAEAFAYPGDAGKSIVIAMDTDRPRLELDVLTPLSRDAEANLANTEGTHVGDISFFIFVVEDRGPRQIEAAVRGVLRRLKGARMPAEFEAHMRQFSDRMPGASFRSIWGKLGNMDDPTEPNELILSLNVPDSTSQTAFTFEVRQEASAGLRERFEQLVLERGLEIVPTQQERPQPMLVETSYNTPVTSQSIYVLRAVVSAARESAPVRELAKAITQEFNLHLAGGLEETLGRRAAIDRVETFVQQELQAGRTGVEVFASTSDLNVQPPTMSKSGSEIVPGVTVPQLVDFAARSTGQVKVVIGGDRGNRVTISSVVGLEELVEGTHYGLDANRNALFLQPVELKKAAALPNGVTLNPSGGSIVIGKGATVFKNTSLMGPMVIGEDSEVGGLLLGTEQKPLVIGDHVKIHRINADVKRSVIGPQTHINGADATDVTVVPYRRGQTVVPAEVGFGSAVLEGSVLIGGKVGTGVKLYGHQVVGPYVAIGNNSEHDESLFWGAAKEAPIFFPHHGYTETFWAVSAAVEDVPLFTPAYRDRLREIMRAVVFGELKSLQPNEAAPISASGIQYTATFTVDGQEVAFPVQRINFGAGTTTSDYSPLTGARASGSAEAGAATGVYSTLKLPAFLASRSLVGNLSVGEKVVGEGTIILTPPEYRPPMEGSRSVDKFTLPTGILSQVDIQWDYFHRVAISAEVLAEAATRASDPFTLAGYTDAVRAIRGAFGGIGPRYRKGLTAGLDLSLETLKTEYSGAPSVTEKERTRRDRIGARIQEQTTLLERRDALLNEYDGIVATIERAVTAVETVTQPKVAEWVGNQILNPGSAWTNPLAKTGLEESAGTTLTAPAAFTYTGTPITTITALKQALASVSRVSVPTAADPTQQPAFVVAPDGLPKFGTAAMIFRPSGDALIPVDLIARDADHRARVLADVKALDPQGFDIQVHDLQAEFKGNVGEAIAALEMKQMQAGLNPHLVTAMTGLEEIARFLGIPFAEGAFRSLDLVASDSNDVWS